MWQYHAVAAREPEPRSVSDSFSTERTAIGARPRWLASGEAGWETPPRPWNGGRALARVNGLLSIIFAARAGSSKPRRRVVANMVNAAIPPRAASPRWPSPGRRESDEKDDRGHRKAVQAVHESAMPGDKLARIL